MPIRLGQHPSGKVDMTNVKSKNVGGRTINYRDDAPIIQGSPEEWLESLKQQGGIGRE